MNKKALILLSGGLDSATTAAYANDQEYTLYAISFNYKQKHLIELESAKNIAKFLNISTHHIINIDPEIFGDSALTSKTKVPKSRIIDDNIPVTYVPARNILFLSYALSFAESNKITDIFIGANAIDYSGYPDCRPEFIKAFEEMANLGTKLGQSNKITIRTPLIHKTKSEIIMMGTKLGMDYRLTHSCYDPINNSACGKCDSCTLRLKGFSDANISDPINYQ